MMLDIGINITIVLVSFIAMTTIIIVILIKKTLK